MRGYDKIDYSQKTSCSVWILILTFPKTRRYLMKKMKPILLAILMLVLLLLAIFVAVYFTRIKTMSTIRQITE